MPSAFPNTIVLVGQWAGVWVRGNFVKPKIDTMNRNRQSDTIPSHNHRLPGACPRGPAWEAIGEKAEMRQAVEPAPSPMVACFHKTWGLEVRTKKSRPKDQTLTLVLGELKLPKQLKKNKIPPLVF